MKLELHAIKVRDLVRGYKEVMGMSPQKLHGGRANRAVTLWLTGCIQSEDNFEERM